MTTEKNPTASARTAAAQGVAAPIATAATTAQVVAARDTATRDAAPATELPGTFRHSYSRDRAQLLRRLSRIEGQVRGIARMIEREEYCVDILQQTSALRAAVDAVSLLVLEDHVQGCIRTASEHGDVQQYVDEILDVVRRTIGRPIRSTTRG